MRQAFTGAVANISCNDSPPLSPLEEPGLAACYAAAAQGITIAADRVGQPSLRRAQLALGAASEIVPSPSPDPARSWSRVTSRRAVPRALFHAVPTGAPNFKLDEAVSFTVPTEPDGG
jgi:hypothetical protein